MLVDQSLKEPWTKTKAVEILGNMKLKSSCCVFFVFVLTTYCEEENTRITSVIQVDSLITSPFLDKACRVILFKSSRSHTYPSGSFAMAPDLMHLRIKVTRITEKIARYESHIQFLTQCLASNVLPKGMQIKFGKEALPKSEKLKQTVENTIQSASFQILTSCIDTYTELLRKENLTLHELMYGIFQITDYVTFENIYRRRLSRYVSYKHNITQKKKKKLQSLSKDQSHCAFSPSEISKRKCRRFKRQPDLANNTVTTDVTATKKSVVNLSDVSLTNEQVTLLSCGSKFCPTPRSLDRQQLLDDVKEGCRKLRLKELFYTPDSENETQTRPKFYKRTGFEPPKGRDNGLDLFCDVLEFKTDNYKDNSNPKDNLNRNCRKALKQLRDLVSERKVRITQADKGGAIVVQNLADYLTEAQRQLNNTEHYIKVDKDPTVQIAKQSNKIITELHNSEHIDDNTHRWALTDTDTVRTHIYYHLPKIHKNPTTPPGRPIISGCGGPTEKLSHVVDSWLQTLVTKLPSYVKDSTHMLNIIQDWNAHYGPFENITLVTIDVNSLYTSIPHADITTAVKHFLGKQTDDTLPPTRAILQATQHVLLNNYFTFENQYYKQIHGTAMGTPMAPAVANLFMGWLEAQLLKHSPVPIEEDLWRRFIDDIFVLWLGTKEELNIFYDFINSFHPSIRFTIQTSQTNISFLDILIKIKDGLLQTDIFVKPTDANTYLHYTSAHPRHCKNNIPFSQFLRLRRICSQDTDFHIHSATMAQQFRERGYPEDIIQRALQKVKQIPRIQTLQYRHKRNNQRIPFVITYNPRNPPFKLWFKENLPQLHASTRLQKAIPHPPILGHRNCRSLKNLLMPSALPSAIAHNKEAGCFKCNKPRCVLCDNHLVETTTFTSSITSEKFSIRQNMTCETSNIIYLLFCHKCPKSQYVGETKNSLKQRFYQHRSNVNKNTGTHVTKHFNQENHSLADLRCIALEKQYSCSHPHRLKREAFWIRKLNTLYPSGLNTI